MNSPVTSTSESTLAGLTLLSAVILCCFITAVLAYGSGLANVPAQDSDQLAAELCRDISGAEHARCVEDKLALIEERVRGQKDLVAQQGAAGAAIAGAGIALLTLIVSIVGLWFIKKTFDETRAAVGLARQEWLDSREIQRANMIHQGVHIMPVPQPDPSHELFFLSVVWKNAGQTNARKCNLEIQTSHVAQGADAPNPWAGMSGPPVGVSGTVGPQECVETPGIPFGIASFPVRLAIFSQAVFEDVFSNDRIVEEYRRIITVYRDADGKYDYSASVHGEEQPRRERT